MLPLPRKEPRKMARLGLDDEDDVIGNVEVDWENTYRLPFFLHNRNKTKSFSV